MTAEQGNAGRKLLGFVLVVGALLIFGLAYRGHADRIAEWREGNHMAAAYAAVTGATYYENDADAPSNGGLMAAAAVSTGMLAAGFVCWAKDCGQ